MKLYIKTVRLRNGVLHRITQGHNSRLTQRCIIGFLYNPENSDESLVSIQSNFKLNSNRNQQSGDYINCLKTEAQINHTEARVHV